MTQKTSIEWADFSSNPIRVRRLADGKMGWGCEHYGCDCEFCYAEKRNQWVGTGLSFAPTSRSEIEVVLVEKELQKLAAMPSGRVFMVDMSDLFWRMVPDDYIARVLDVLEANTRITPMLLTKRTERMATLLGKRWGTTPPSHIWVGASAGNQQAYDQRRSGLEATPACVRFWSLEPLLSAIDLKEPKGIHQVIIGGESGSSRGCEIGWIRELVSQCRAHGIAPFVKQLGSVQARRMGCSGKGQSKGQDMATWPDDLRVREFAAGA